uniref:exocyst complex component 8 isoform X4 n=1 Tax=Myxine glutinosa TaxID=7769 RepID=UPI00358F6EE2
MAEMSRLQRQMMAPLFDPQQYVQTLSQQSDADRDLQEQRLHVQKLVDDTALNLKRNVYKNYHQFIETAKEISYLESEMYQLSHILTEQKSVMESITQHLRSTDKEEASKEKPAAFPKETEEVKQRTLTTLLEKVEGCGDILETPGRYLVYNGDLIEYDPESMSQVQRVHAFLMNDCLLVASWLPNRRGAVRYRYNSLYQLGDLAVVNVKDNGPMKDMFKVMRYPDCCIFQAESSKIKKEWLEILDETKRNKALSDKLKKEQERPLSPKTPDTPLDPFAEEPEMSPDIEEDPIELSEPWIQDLPEDLDVCIAQRDFEGAVDLLDKFEEFVKEQPVTQAVTQLSRVGERVKQLTDVLVFELSPDRYLRGGPRATRRAVSQLIRLGQATKACQLFLKNRECAVRTALRQLRMEGSTGLCVRTLCHVFFCCLLQTTREFQRNFAAHPGCYSALVVWQRLALQLFADAFSQQVFDSKECLSSIAECVALACSHCEKLSNFGLDLTFTLQSLLLKDIKGAVQASKDVIIEATKHRNSEETWRQMNLMIPQAQQKLMEEMETSGVPNFEQHIGKDCWVNLSYTVVAFSKQLLAFLEDGLRLYQPELHMVLVEGLVEVVLVEVQHVDYSLRCEQDPAKKGFIQHNAAFLLDAVLPRLQQRFQETVGLPAKQLQDLQRDISKIPTLQSINSKSQTSDV